MCDPVSITLGVATAGLGIASSVSAAGAAEDQAQAQYKAESTRAYNQQKYQNDVARYQNEKYQLAIQYQQDLGEWQSEKYYENAANIKESLNAQYGAVFDRIDQTRAQTLDGIDKAGKASDKGASFVTVSASESGTQGNSIRLAKQQFARAESEYANIAFNNLKNKVNQEKYNMIAMRANAQNRINAMMPGPMQRVDTPGPQQSIEMPSYNAPSMTPYLLQGAGAVLGGVSTGYSMSALRGLGTATPGIGEVGSPYMGPPAP